MEWQCIDWLLHRWVVCFQCFGTKVGTEMSIGNYQPQLHNIPENEDFNFTLQTTKI
jgi:hypothetical protein